MHVTRSRRHKRPAVDRLLHWLGFIPGLSGNGISLRQKSVALLLAMMLLLQTIQWGALLQHTSAAPVPDTVIKQVLLLQGQSFSQAELVACFDATAVEPASPPSVPPAGCDDLLLAVKNGSVTPSYSGELNAALGAASYPFTLAYEWEIDDTVAGDGGSYVFPLPPALKLENDASGSIGAAGTFFVDKITKQVTVTFVDQPGDPITWQKKGGIQINAWLEETTVIENKEIEIIIPYSATGSVTYDLPVDIGTPTPNIAKRVASVDRAVNTSRINWEIDVNTSLADITKLIVRDTLPAELELDQATDFAVHPLQISMAGAVTEQPALAPGAYAVTPPTPGNQFSVEILGGPTSKAYRIKFSTDVKSDANITEAGNLLTNSAQVLDDTVVRAATSAQVTVKRGPMLTKTSSNYLQDQDHEATWTLLFNFGEVTHTDPELSDLLPLGHEFVTGSMVVERVAVNANGSAGAVLGTVTPGAGANQYELTHTTYPALPQAAAQKDSFNLKLNGTVGSAYKIVYRTKAKAVVPVLASQNKSNLVTFDSDPGKTASDDVDYTQRVITKGGSITNYNLKEITWTIVLNRNDYRFDDDGAAKLKLVDTFNYRGLSLQPGLTITPKGGAPLVEGAGNDYVLTPTTDGAGLESGFEIVFNDAYVFDREHTITYKTTFDYDLYPAVTPPNPQWTPGTASKYQFRNTGVFSWGKVVDKATGTTTYSGPGSQTAAHTQNVNDNTRYNGYKNGTYNAMNKRINWNVMFNYHNETVPGAVFTDTLLSGQQLVNGTVVVKRQTISANSNGTLSDAATLVAGTDYTLGYVEPAGADPVLTITFIGNITGPHLVTFQTEMAGEIVPQTINNTGQFTSGNNNYRATLTASVSPPFGNEFIVKRFRQPDNTALRLVEWTLWINRSLSDLTSIVIEDTPDQYQTIVADSFVLHRMLPNIPNPTADGHFTANPTTALVRDVDYTITPLAGSPNGFTVTITNPDEAAYRLVYNALLAEGVGSSATNQYSMSGFGSTIVSTPSQHTFNVNKSGASGFSFPSSAAFRGSVKLTKQADDDNSVKLQGATFKIKPKYGADTIPTQTTDANGEVVFTNLPFDVYELIEVTAPSGYKLDTTAREIIINSTTEQEIIWNNVINSGRIGNYVWLDVNEDGLQNDGAASGINGITVRLYKDGDPAVFRTTATTNSGTGEPGYYLFDGLEPGDYVVEFEWPVSYELTQNVSGHRAADSNPLDSNNKTDVITIDRGNTPTAFEDLTIDLGLIAKGALGNYVWLDWDRDGVQDSDEEGVNGIEAVLYQVTGGGSTEVARTTTANHPTDSTAGYYWFKHLLAGTYAVEFLVPNSYTTTQEGQGTVATDSNDTTAQAALGDGRIPYRTNNIVISGPSSWVNPTIDLGLVALGKIGDYVWFDRNDNGIQETGEPGIENILVELYREVGGVETLVTTTRTDADGKYLFDHLVAGNYYVKFETPSIYDLAKMGEGGDTSIDSNLIHTTGSNKGKTVNVIPIGPGNWENMTIDLGFTGKGAIGNYVWHDRNRNGIQDEDPMHGINGVTVHLYRNTPSGTPYKTDVTKTEDGKPGYYGFTELPQGTYYVKFVFPDEYETTAAETNDDSATGSNWLNASNVTNAIEIGETVTPYGWVDPSIDLGLVAQGSIGNYVWFDWNRNGIQEASEQGLNGITLRLYKNGATGPVYAETTTANGPDGKPGYYLFDNLASGDYYVQVVLDDNHELTSAEQGSGAGADELDSNSVNASNTTAAITIGELAPRGWHDPTIDFGIVRKGAIGNYVWYDVDYDGRQNELESYGINGVTVKLYDSAKTLLATTVTANKDGKAGYYLFDHLVAGNYYVKFETPLFYILTRQGAPSVSASQDSNPTLDGFTETIAIGAVGPAVWRDMTIDQGYYYVPPVFPTPTPTPTTDPEETEQPGVTPTPKPPTPTPVPGTGTPTPAPTSTTVTEKTPEDTPIDVEVEVPKGGTTVTGTPPKHGNVTITPDGKVNYTPDKSYTGKDRFSVIVKDKDGNEEEVWFDIEVEEPPLGGFEGIPDVGKLPKTGQQSYLLLYLIGGAFIALGIYIRVRSNRKPS